VVAGEGVEIMGFAYKAVLLSLLVTTSFVAGYRLRGPDRAASAHNSRHILYYACPMHPQYKSDRPGDAPCCGMRLEPVHAGPDSRASAASLPPGAVEIGTAQQQMIGVRTGEVERTPTSHLLRVPGRVSVDEERLHRIVAAADGWIRRLGPNPAGTFVEQNEVLATYYAPELFTSQQSLFYALNAAGQVQRGQLVLSAQPAAENLNVQVAIDALRGLGMSDRQILELRRSAAAASEINIYSPISGFVIARNVSPSQRFDKGSELYRIADLGHVWVMTDIFEKDREFLRQGTMASVHYQGRTFNARMSEALQQFDPQSRTLKTRFELDNPGHMLRPDMFVDVEVHITMAEAVTVPAEAVLDSGYRKAVYVELGNGIFEPRVVETGWQLGDRVQITRGLEPGDRIVVSGNFLIDSESRMRFVKAGPAAVAGKSAREKDLVCGMDVDPKAPNAIGMQHAGNTYHFCSDHCKRSFAANPAKYIRKKTTVAERPGAREAA
jgi:RND family efflux transporter MFP subunit